MYQSKDITDTKDVNATKNDKTNDVNGSVDDISKANLQPQLQCRPFSVFYPQNNSYSPPLFKIEITSTNLTQ